MTERSRADPVSADEVEFDPLSTTREQFDRARAHLLGFKRGIWP